MTPPFNIHQVMAGLSSRRPIFHSEADFQHELAWEIHAMYDDCLVRLEFPPFPDLGKRMAIDIWLPSEQIAIELKYPTRKLDWTDQGERFSLALGARDVARYDFLKDIQRIEQIAAGYEPVECGFVVLLTNDYLLWERSNRTDVVDAEFHIYDGKRIGDGEIRWGIGASDGTKRSREEPINLSRSYVLNWQGYSSLGNERGERFRYLAVAVPPAKESTP